MLFIDPSCPKPYTSHSLLAEPLGGTEATVIRVADGLPNSVVMQHNRTQPLGAEWEGETRYKPLNWHDKDFGGIVVLRSPSVALMARGKFKSRPLYLWLHDLANQQSVQQFPALFQAGIELVVVSQFHKHQVMDTARRFLGDTPLPKLHVIHNPIDDALRPEGTQVNPNKLVFFSSPHKGLNYTLEIFSLLKTYWRPDLELHLANPGYLPTPPIEAPGVIVHGSLTHAQTMQHVRESFCVFYPNLVFPETFGLVYAEANAVGTPVLTHGHGSAREVVSSSEQIVDCRNKKELIDKFDSWHPGNRPVVAAREEFRLSNVLKKWGGLE